jgi:hypothetical protein
MHYTSRYHPKRFSFGNSYYQKLKLVCIFTKHDKSPKRVLRRLLQEEQWLKRGYYFVSAVYYSRRTEFPVGVFGWMDFEEVLDKIFDFLRDKSFCNALLTLSFSFTDHPMTQQLLGVEKRDYAARHQKSDTGARQKKKIMLRILDRYRAMGFMSFYV